MKPVIAIESNITQESMKKTRRHILMKHSVKLSTEVDKVKLHLELEKTANMFASEAEKMESNSRPIEDSFEATDTVAISNRSRQKKENSVRKNPYTYRMSGITRQCSVDVKNSGNFSVGVKCRQKKEVGRKNSSKMFGNTLKAYSAVSVCDSEGEEWLGWNSEVSVQCGVPEREILSSRGSTYAKKIVNSNSALKTYSICKLEEAILLELKAVTEGICNTDTDCDASEEDWQGWPEPRSSAAFYYPFNMMIPPASDITKVLQNKQNIKTKKNFQFKLNNSRRQNGSVGTILTTEENLLKGATKDVKEDSCLAQVDGNTKGLVRPCYVTLTRLSESELVNIGCMPISLQKCSSKRDMKKCRSSKAAKPPVRLSSEVDKTELHLELEKAASTFASEAQQTKNRCNQFEKDFENTESFIVSRKGKQPETLSVPERCNRNLQMNVMGGMNELNIIATRKHEQKRSVTRANRKNLYDVSSASDDSFFNDSEEEEWLGWNSKVTPLDTVPGAEIVSITENGNVEDIINWNTKVESDSDMDVEEVFLLTDLEEIKLRTGNTDCLSNDSIEGWPGWPEHKSSSALCYVFKV